MSCLSCDNSVDDIKKFARSKIREPFEFFCYKMRPSLDNSISSFKLYVADDKFGEIINPAFWLQGVLVREFVFRPSHRRNGANLPGPISQRN